MPPTKKSSPPATEQLSPPSMYNPAQTHPVFFTDCWRKPPFPVPFNNGFNPVATGYVFGDGRPRTGFMTKL